MVKEIQNKHIYGPKSFPQSSLLVTVLLFSLLQGDDSLSITHPFSGFRFCVINHVSAPKLLSFISVTCCMDTRKAHTVPYNQLIICAILQHPLCTHFSVIQLVRDNSLHYPANVLLWQRQQLNVSVRHASPVVDMLHAQATTRQHVLPLLKAMHHICLFS